MSRPSETHTAPVAPGTLYIVATPIGHLDDMTHRAVAVLQAVDVIAAEDTRHSQRLLQHYAIKTPMTALHEHNERAHAARLLARVAAGEAVALISDAGTPLISDPGYHLVKQAHAQGISVVPIPGASAVTSALCVSGLATDRFYFEGFLPSKQGARDARLQQLRTAPHTLIFYEAPHRLSDTLHAMVEVFGSVRAATLARELTKTHETIHHDTLGALVDWVLSDNNQQKGECVLVVAGYVATDAEQATEIDAVLTVLLAELPLKQAAKLAAAITGCTKNRCYQRALFLQSRN